MSVRSFAAPSTMTLGSDEAAAYGRYRMKVRSREVSIPLPQVGFAQVVSRRHDEAGRVTVTIMLPPKDRRPRC